MTVELYGTPLDDFPQTQLIDYKSFSFSAGELQVRLPDISRYNNLTIVSRYPTSQDLIEISMVLSAINNLNTFSGQVTLLLPYLPYSRQDRVCYAGEAFSLQALAGLLASGLTPFDRVVTWDVHSNEALTVFQEEGVDFFNVPPEAFVSKFRNLGVDLSSSHVVIAPDKGAVERANSVAKEIGANTIFYAEKKRDPSNGNILGIEIAPGQGEVNLHNREILIVDDICDGGKTFIELAKTLWKYNPKEITLYVTHGIFSKGLDVFYENGKLLIDTILTPNLMPGDHSYVDGGNLTRLTNSEGVPIHPRLIQTLS